MACSAEVATKAGKFRADALAAKLPKRAWQKLSAGRGAKGHRFYDWAVIDLTDPRPGSRQLLIRRNRSTGERAYYRCYSPAAVPLTTLVRMKIWMTWHSVPENSMPIAFLCFTPSPTSAVAPVVTVTPAFVTFLPPLIVMDMAGLQG